MSNKTDRTDIDPDTLPKAPGTEPGGELAHTPDPSRPLRHKATQYNGELETPPLENDSGTFYPQDNTPAVLDKKEGPRNP